jgi:hypothetical protein
MAEPSLTDRSKAEALARELRTSFFDKAPDYSALILCALALGATLHYQIFKYLPFDLPLIASNIVLFVMSFGLAIWSIFILRKRRVTYFRELENIYEELFREGIDDDLVSAMVKYSFMYVNLPKQVSEHEKQERIRAKREGWAYDTLD